MGAQLSLQHCQVWLMIVDNGWWSSSGIIYGPLASQTLSSLVITYLPENADLAPKMPEIAMMPLAFTKNNQPNTNWPYSIITGSTKPDRQGTPAPLTKLGRYVSEATTWCLDSAPVTSRTYRWVTVSSGLFTLVSSNRTVISQSWLIN